MRVISKKMLAVLFTAVFVITALAGCGGVSSLARPTPDPSASLLPVTGSCAISKNGDVFTVSGTTDIMNGALIHISVVAQDGTAIHQTTITKVQNEISEQFTITAEQLKDVVDLKGYISCAPSYYGKQPNEVYDAYGKQFQNIINDTDTAVWTTEGVLIMFASDWLYGIVPQTTPGPTPVPAATPEAAPAVSGEAAATPSA